MVNYLNKYSCLADLGESLGELTKKNTQFIWGPEHKQVFEATKEEMTSALMPKYYDPNKPLTLQTDASLKGLGVILLWEEHPIYFASKNL